MHACMILREGTCLGIHSSIFLLYNGSVGGKSDYPGTSLTSLVGPCQNLVFCAAFNPGRVIACMIKVVNVLFRWGGGFFFF